MAKKRFSATEFRDANERVKSGDVGDFPTINSGVYLVTIDRANLHEGDGSDSLTAMFQLQIDEDDESFANQKIFYSQNLTKKDGSSNEIGMVALNQFLTLASDGCFNADDFINDPDLELEKFLFTKLRVKATIKPQKDNPKFSDTKIEVLGVIENRYSGKAAVKPNAAADEESMFSDEEAVEDNTGLAEDEVEIEIGDFVTYHHSKGDFKAEIMGFVEETGQLLITPESATGKKMKQMTVSQDVVDFLEKGPKKEEGAEALFEEEEEEEEEEEAEEEAEEATLEVGSTVVSVFKGKTFAGGVIKSIDEDTGTCKISYNGKLRKCKLEVTSLP